jgi:hypothetical protein
MDIWSKHKCIPPEGRVVEIAGRFYRHCRCHVCARDFVEDMESHEQWAVSVSAFDFIHLAPDISIRWLNEPCPKKRLDSDEHDRLSETYGGENRN